MWNMDIWYYLKFEICKYVISKYYFNDLNDLLLLIFKILSKSIKL